MKKFLMGLILGLFLSVGAVAYADDIQSMLGKKVEGTFPVYINEQKIEKDGIVIEGTTYVPARLIAEKFGSEVSFIDSQVKIKPLEGVLDVLKSEEYKKARQAEFDKAREERQKQKTPEQIKQEELDAKMKSDEENRNRVKRMYVPDYIPSAPFPAINFQGTMYVPLPESSNKYGIRLKNFEHATNTLTFEEDNLKIIIDGDIESLNPKDGFVYHDVMYIKESILMEIQKQQQAQP